MTQYNFPRATDHAAVMATAAAAKRLHDARIGKRRCTHLFRLSLGEEMLLHRAMHDTGTKLLPAIPTRREEAMHVLEIEAGEVIAVEAGPVQVGSTMDAFTAAGLAELAKHYWAAFRQDIQCLPYFAAARR